MKGLRPFPRMTGLGMRRTLIFEVSILPSVAHPPSTAHSLKGVYVFELFLTR